ncbi:hypothetical protein CLV35_2628 [Motilibacter peucedani]|uniref:Uncharacterized protein n=1 Tax=Motilibacter peucedani TaxID=598650 RepID=A0A420XPK9_9ACTN|nr:hypothetical protein [Motilibacter peucedani]RKS74127.1 hypothetical protein CLV35_2628 [Motilibacter peucedani]
MPLAFIAVAISLALLEAALVPEAKVFGWPTVAIAMSAWPIFGAVGFVALKGSNGAGAEHAIAWMFTLLYLSCLVVTQGRPLLVMNQLIDDDPHFTPRLRKQSRRAQWLLIAVLCVGAGLPLL